MVFNTAVYIFFFLIVFSIYWSLSKIGTGARLQNRFLLFASYVFYGYWDWIFLSLIVISTVVDYFSARIIETSQNNKIRKSFVTLSLCVNLGLLGIFKYFDFFASSLIEMVRVFNPEAFPDGGQSIFLKVILPVGISFYTFQTLSYTIDVYRKVIPAEKNFLDFALFVSFFPQLVAGPIERAGNLLPQIKERRHFSMENFRQGIWLILLGFFMKVYVADNLGPLVDKVFLTGVNVYNVNPDLAGGHGGFQILMAGIAFAFQVYGDFAGYSNIALGSALLMGIRLTVNFNAPQMSQNPVELWQRWHITLSRWVRDYIYIPLGGSHYGEFRKNLHLFITFTLMGFWHGANWTFVIWGVFHAILLISYNLIGPYLPRLPENIHPLIRGTVKILKMVGMFLLLAFSGLFFRSYDLNHIIIVFRSLFDFPWNLTESINQVAPAGKYMLQVFNKIWVLLILDAVVYRTGDQFWVFKRSIWLRSLVYIIMLYSIIVLGFFGRDVIYFAF